MVNRGCLVYLNHKNTVSRTFLSGQSFRISNIRYYFKKCAETGQSLSVCEQSFNMRYRIFCCTCPRTGSRDSHTCVANYTNHSRNICGKFKNRPGRESLRFQRRAAIKHSTLARTRFKHAFSTQNETNSGRVITGISKTGESELRHLVNLGCF